jgi:hypothetical protein
VGEALAVSLTFNTALLKEVWFSSQLLDGTNVIILMFRSYSLVSSKRRDSITQKNVVLH